MSSPFELFDQWFSEANATDMIEPNAMVLSTVNEQGLPQSRVVLLKRMVDDVFYFFTNYNSAKSQALLAHPSAALNFHWRKPQHRQVRIEGSVIKATPEISEEYFRSRPRGSQIGAWASPQSQVIQNRQELEERVKMFEKQFEGREVPLPQYWGGFGIVAKKMEFWSEGEFRLHERRQFTRENEQSSWVEELLAP